jgi:hypothetical protein
MTSRSGSLVTGSRPALDGHGVKIGFTRALVNAAFTAAA